MAWCWLGIVYCGIGYSVLIDRPSRPDHQLNVSRCVSALTGVRSAACRDNDEVGAGLVLNRLCLRPDILSRTN